MRCTMPRAFKANTGDFHGRLRTPPQQIRTYVPAVETQSVCVEIVLHESLALLWT